MKLFSLVLKFTSIIGLLSVIFLILLGIFRIGRFLSDPPILLICVWGIISTIDIFILILLQIGMNRPLKVVSRLFWLVLLFCAFYETVVNAFDSWESFILLGVLLLIALYKVKKAFDWREEEDSLNKMFERCRKGPG
jgi:hypothetical protein